MGEDGGGGGNGGGGGGHGGASGGVVHAGNGEVGAPHAPTDHGHGGKHNGGSYNNDGAIVREVSNPMTSSRPNSVLNPFSRKNTGIDLDDYFVCRHLGLQNEISEMLLTSLL